MSPQKKRNSDDLSVQVATQTSEAKKGVAMAMAEIH